VDRAAKIDVFIENDVVEEIKLYDPKPNSTPRTVAVWLKMPDTLDRPGNNLIYVTAKEMPLDPKGVSAVTAIRALIVIKVPYPGYYVEATFDSPSVNLGETVPFKVSVNNLGTNRVETAYAIIDVYEDNNRIKTLTTDTKSMDSKASADFTVDMATTGMKPGSYKAVATFVYDGNQIKLNNTLNVGTLFVSVVNYTSEMVQGRINKFDIIIESRWNDPISNVYATAAFEGQAAKTPNYDLAPWETKVISTYLDTANQAFGDHDVNITLYYQGKTTAASGKIKIIPEPVVAPPSEENPASAKPKEANISTVYYIGGAVALIIILDILYIFITSRMASKAGLKDKKSKTDKK
jgi:hypothetical protein